MLFACHQLKVLLLLVVITEAGLCVEAFDSNPHYLCPPNGVCSETWLQQASSYRQTIRAGIEAKADGDAWGIYTNDDMAWMSRNFTCRMCMMFDSDFYDPQTNQYLIESLLAEGEKEFGGYDSIVLWHAYPRLGIDERNQFDMYREMPGGLSGLRRLVEKCHSRDVRVFINYNPWDIGTHREDKDDCSMLAEIVSAINADGVFLDTLSAAEPNLRAALDRVKPSIALVSEGHPPFEQLSICNGSWAQWLDEPARPGLLKLKWVEPRHMQYQIRRWDRCRSDEVATALFNGSGMLIWENIFGTYNPWQLQDRRVWHKANKILHFFADYFVKGQCQAYYPSRRGDLYINRWCSDAASLYTMVNCAKRITEEGLFEVAVSESSVFYDVWNGERIEPEQRDGSILVRGSIDKLGCILQVRQSEVDRSLEDFLATMQELSSIETASVDTRNFAESVTLADKVPSTALVDRKNTPIDMVFVPCAVIALQIEHIRGECGCYPDPGQTLAETEDFGYGLKVGAVYPQVIHKPIKHKIGPIEVKPFFIDQTEVTNAQYRKFLDSSGYQPRYKQNFLKHWPNGQMPEQLADHPVVYIDIDDARAYAKWAGKRLPTEAEWQLAAQGTDGRKWPWGNDFDPNKCNTTGTHTLPVKSCPQGKSPYGCYHMSGNVWEWTESCRSDGHTRFVMIRGGSYFDAEGSIWYVKGGPQPCGHHAKFIRIWPGLDRCSTVGFRCVVDAK